MRDHQKQPFAIRAPPAPRATPSSPRVRTRAPTPENPSRYQGRPERRARSNRATESSVPATRRLQSPNPPSRATRDGPRACSASVRFCRSDSVAANPKPPPPFPSPTRRVSSVDNQLSTLDLLLPLPRSAPLTEADARHRLGSQQREEHCRDGAGDVVAAARCRSGHTGSDRASGETRLRRLSTRGRRRDAAEDRPATLPGI
jgi:hypothetical protein